MAKKLVPQKLIVSEPVERPDDELLQVPIDSIHPNPQNARTSFVEQRVEELADSIRQQGILQPLLVREIEGQQKAVREFQVIAGDTRLLAAKRAGELTIPVLVRKCDETEARKLSLIENIQREDLNAVDQGRAFIALHEELQLVLRRWLSVAEGVNRQGKVYAAEHERVLAQHPDVPSWVLEVVKRYVASGYRDRQPQVAWGDLARQLGISVHYINRFRRITRLPDEIQAIAIDAGLGPKQMEALTQLRNLEDQRQLAHEIIGQGLMTEQAYRRAREIKARNSSIQVCPKEHVYGQPLHFRGLHHAPINEQGTVLLFGMVAKELNFTVESVRVNFPDCEAKRCVDSKRNRWGKVRIEFEFQSRHFLEHGHDTTQCDLIVCWEHNWPECPEGLEVLELKSAIKSLPSDA